MNRLIFPTLLVTLVANVALAESTYIECLVTSESGDEELKHEVRLSESNGKVTHKLGTGFTFNADGFFSAKTITYKHTSNLGQIILTRQYEIDRTNLDILVSSEIKPSDPKYLEAVPPTVSITKGKCEVIEVPERKI